MNTGDMEKYCPKPHPVYFNAFSMWQQLSGSVQYLINNVIKIKKKFIVISFPYMLVCVHMCVRI